MRSIPVISALLFSFITKAETVKPNGFSDAEMTQMAEANAITAQFDFNYPTLFTSESVLSFSLMEETQATPYAEYDDAGCLIFSSNFAFNSREAKRTMAEHLPEGVQLVIFTGTASEGTAARVKETYRGLIDPERITVVYMPGASWGFWARDSIPVPVFRYPNNVYGDGIFTVVDAKYTRFEQDARFRDLFNAKMTKYNYFYGGGNFMANDLNDCLVVNTKATGRIPDNVFENHYGCEKLIRLPYVKGIGHADESVKFVDEKTVLTDEESYVSVLEEAGFDVIRLPRPDRRYETYVNSLMVNGVVYVPIFNEKNDEKALQVYRDLGFAKVIGINTRTLSNEGLGSLHCITMTYPPVEMNELLNSTGGSVLQ